MARTETVENILADARLEADQVEGTFVTDAQGIRLASAGYAELYCLLADADPKRFLASSDLTTTADTKEYLLSGASPSITTFYQLMGVSMVEGDNRYPLERHEWAERYDGGDPAYPAMEGAGTYRIIKGGQDGSTVSIAFEPEPGSHTYEIEYIPAPTKLTLVSDTVDGVAGWESYIVHYVAEWMAVKEESFELAAYLNSKMAIVRQRIAKLARQRDAATAPKVQRRFSRRRRWRR